MITTLLKRYWRECLIGILSCFIIWLSTLKNKTRIETKTEYVDKVVVKVEERIVYKDRVQVKTRTIYKKGDETRVQETTTTGERSIDSGVREESQRETKQTVAQSVVTEHEAPRFVLGIGRDFSTGGLSGRVQYRIFPGIPLAVGPEVNVTNKVWSLGLGVSIAL